MKLCLTYPPGRLFRYNEVIMLEHIQEILQIKGQLLPSAPILVGVSGGPDSLCLWDVLHRLGYPTIVAHLNHGLRPEAEKEAEGVRKAAAATGVPCVIEQAKVAEIAERESLSLEEAARTARYSFLFSQAQRLGAQAVAVAHTADDQVETVLMHLLRGAGLSGLSGMQYRTLPNPWSKTIPLIRPLLDIWRSEVLVYCAERALQPVYDATNLDQAFFRNRLRYDLIPSLEEYNPAARRLIWQTADTLRGDSEIIEKAVDSVWKTCAVEIGPGYVALDEVQLRDQSIGMQRQLLRHAIGWLRPGLRDIGYAIIERGLKFLLEARPGTQTDLAAGLRLYYESERLWVTDWQVDLPAVDWPQLPEEMEEYPIEIPGEITLAGNWKLYAQTVTDLQVRQSEIFHNIDPFQTWLDSESIPEQLLVRARRPGDRFRPLGMDGQSVKVSDLMINAKLLKRLRPAWPLVCAGKDIVWIPGLRPGEYYRVNSKTRRSLHLRLNRSPGP